VPAAVSKPGDIDISALLAAAFDEKPSDDMPDRVTARLALVTTMIEFARLFTLAPAGLASPVDDASSGEGEDP
jgi:hypothetical protein